MPGRTVTLRRADEDAMAYVERLLERASLPTGDVDAHAGRFYVAHTDAARVGVGGFERYGTDALLRSIAVEPAKRETGLGTAVVDGLEAEARDAGVEDLYLLTTTAGDFFAALGYAETDRTEVPDAIRDTTQFSDRCPSSAACMRKSL